MSRHAPRTRHPAAGARETKVAGIYTSGHSDGKISAELSSGMVSVELRSGAGSLQMQLVLSTDEASRLIVSLQNVLASQRKAA